MQVLNKINSQPAIIEKAVYSTICYFDVFKYPLKKEEILKYCSEKISEAQLDHVLQKLLSEKRIFTAKNFYFLEEEHSRYIDSRIENEIRLTTSFSKIKKYAGLVSSFPFVEAVFYFRLGIEGIINKRR